MRIVKQEDALSGINTKRGIKVLQNDAFFNFYVQLRYEVGEQRERKDSNHGRNTPENKRLYSHLKVPQRSYPENHQSSGSRYIVNIDK